MPSAERMEQAYQAVEFAFWHLHHAGREHDATMLLQAALRRELHSEPFAAPPLPTIH